jgi:hypothetical protein
MVVHASINLGMLKREGGWGWIDEFKDQGFFSTLNCGVALAVRDGPLYNFTEIFGDNPFAPQSPEWPGPNGGVPRRRRDSAVLSLSYPYGGIR